MVGTFQCLLSSKDPKGFLVQIRERHYLDCFADTEECAKGPGVLFCGEYLEDELETFCWKSHWQRGKIGVVGSFGR